MTVNNAINNQQLGSLNMAVQLWTSIEAAVDENNTADASYLTLGVDLSRPACSSVITSILPATSSSSTQLAALRRVKVLVRMPTENLDISTRTALNTLTSLNSPPSDTSTSHIAPKYHRPPSQQAGS